MKEDIYAYVMAGRSEIKRPIGASGADTEV
jgi:hypothetical protein